MSYGKFTSNNIDIGKATGDLSLAAYRAFVKRKAEISKSFGFQVEDSEINPILKPHQRVSVRWGAAGGRRAWFEAFGLGKTVIQLETIRLVMKKARAGKPGLIVCPLGVRQEFKRDAKMLGIPVSFIRSVSEVENPDGIYLTNYETVRDGKLDPSAFGVASLDEAKILSGFGGVKTFREFMVLFEPVQYRFVATATPDPNEYIELLAFSAFLGIMDVSQAKTRFFKRDSVHADRLTIHPHKEQEFWLWVSTWALFLQTPSDLGPEYSDEGYDLPDLEVIYHEIKAGDRPIDCDRGGQYRLVRDASMGVVDAAREKRDSIDERVEVILQIVRSQSLHEEMVSGTQGAGRDAEPGLAHEQQRASGRTVTGLAGQTQRQAENRGSRALLEKQGPCAGSGSGVESSASGENKGASEDPQYPQSGQDHASEPRMVSQPQAASERDKPKKQTKTKIRDNTVGIRASSAGSVWPLRNLPNRDDTEWRADQDRDGYRSLPRDGQGAGPFVPDVQYGAGTVSRQSGTGRKGFNLSRQFIVWCDLNHEQEQIDRALEDEGISVSSLYGAMDPDKREELLEQWRNRETVAFVSKPSMYGAGVNLQQCSDAIFAGIGFKFAEFLQSIKRIHRFLQAKRVTIHLIYTDNERGVLAKLMKKWEQYKVQVAKMTELIREYGLSELSLAQALARAEGVDRFEIVGENYRLVNNDSVEEIHTEVARIADSSVQLILSSVPFAQQYEYSPNLCDMGHTNDSAHFWEQMDFLIPQLLRVLEPGRLAAIHVKDRIVPGGLTGLGFQTVYPFHLDAIQHFIKHGFAYMGMKTVVTDVVRENNQTYRLGWSEQCKDGTKMGVGMPEYLLIFRKPPSDSKKSYADNPVKKRKSQYSRSRWQIDAHGFTRSSGNRLLTPEELQALPHAAIFKLFREFSLNNVYDFEHHVHLGESMELHSVQKGLCKCDPPERCRHGRLPVTFMLLQPPSWHPDVWTDITRMLTLNGAQSAKGRQLHLCAFQFDIVDRVITQFTNPGETVLDPFGGLCTTAVRAIKLKRKAICIELCKSYVLDGATYCKAAEQEVAMPSLFDLGPEVEDAEPGSLSEVQNGNETAVE